LTQGEVERLYARRRSWERDWVGDAEGLLRSISSDAFSPTPRGVFLLLRVTPLGGDRALLARAGQANGGDELAALREATNDADAVSRSTYSPDLPGLAGNWRRADADQFGATRRSNEETELAAYVGHDGSTTIFSHRVGGPTINGTVVLLEEAIAGLVTRGLALSGRLYRDAGYIGSVDAALIVRPLAGVYSRARAERLGHHEVPYPSEQYARSERYLASELRDDPMGCAARLVLDLTDATAGMKFDPFARLRHPD
jgi:hypothetical protein